MAQQKIKTNFLGVRYREHPTRKHGIKADRCFFVRYKKDGKDKEEMAGWASEGLSAEKAFNLLSTVRENIRKGEGAQSLAAMREEKEAKAAEKIRQAKAAEKSIVTFSSFWEEEYLPRSEAQKKVSTMTSERFLYGKWIAPALGHLPLQNITPAKCEKIALAMLRKNKSAASVRYMLAVISQVWNLAVSRDVIEGESPTRRVKKPKADNRRMRFLSHEEARTLLDALAARSTDLYQAALLALLAGLRAGEIWGLTWADINTHAKTIYIKDPKNKEGRHAFMTAEIVEMFNARYEGQHKTAYVFPARGGVKRTNVSDCFERTVRELGLNGTGELDANGNHMEIKDARQRVVFHTLRHTFASWLVQAGTPLYTLAQLMGHKDIKMTQRYSHLAPDAMQAATMALQGVLAPKKETDENEERETVELTPKKTELKKSPVAKVGTTSPRVKVRKAR